MSEPMADELVVSKVKDALSDMQGMVSEAGFASCVRDLQEFVPRLLALVAAQAEQIAGLQNETERRVVGVCIMSANFDANRCLHRERAEAKVARVRAACDEADRRGLGTDHIRAALDGTEATP